MARADTKLGERLRVAGGFAYSPNVSNTGAWSKYAAFGIGLDLPSNLMPRDITASVTSGAGYFWFGNQSAALGGFPLPAYLNWNAGVIHAQEPQPRPALLRHQSLEREFFRPHWRSECRARRPPQSHNQPRRPDLDVVQRDRCPQI